MGMVLSVILPGVASLVASGVLFRHQRVLTYLAAAGVLFEGQWLLLTLLDRVLLPGVSAKMVFDLGSLALLILWALLYKKWTFPYLSGWGSGRRDAAVIVVLAIVLAASWLVLSSNGWQDGTWVTHGFYNGDTATLISLVQRSLLTDGLVNTNPFAASGELEYPTLLHAGLASLFSLSGEESGWLHYLPIMTLVQIVLTVPMFFLLWDVVWPEFKDRWRLWFGIKSRWLVLASQASIVLFVMALSWDNYIYPQSHFFLTGLFLLQVALLVRKHVGLASVVALILMLSNAVTGTAAVAVVAVYYLLNAADKKREVLQRAAWLAGVMMWIILFLQLTPGEASFGQPGFSYTAAVAMIRLGPALVALLIAVWLALDKQKFLGAAVAMLMVLAFVTFFFSTRNIVVENAERFIYHALLVGFPVLLSPAIRLWYWLQRELIDTARPLGQVMAGWVVVAALLLVTLLPAGASVASAHDNLMFKDEHRVTLLQQEALIWMNDNLETDAVVLASPRAPWLVPIFTGRAVVRVESWLSLQDETLEQIVAAFDGDKAAQEEMVKSAGYLLLRRDEQEWWDASSYDQVFSNTTVTIYRL